MGRWGLTGREGVLAEVTQEQEQRFWTISPLPAPQVLGAGRAARRALSHALGAGNR